VGEHATAANGRYGIERGLAAGTPLIRTVRKYLKFFLSKINTSQQKKGFLDILWQCRPKRFLLK
jgi:hypothetical protein